MKTKQITKLLFLGLLLLSSLTGCSRVKEGATHSLSYKEVNAQEAKRIMDSEENYIILDVRTEAEFRAGHIKDAILIPHDQIYDNAEKYLKDKGKLILVYCRSGNRSKVAANALVKLGYSNIVEFGGINQWPYETVKELK